MARVGRSDRVDARMELEQAPALQAVPDDPGTEAGSQELPPRHNPVLSSGNAEQPTRPVPPFLVPYQPKVEAPLGSAPEYPPNPAEPGAAKARSYPPRPLAVLKSITSGTPSSL